MYYILDGVFALIAGYLFVFNNYLPIIICLICLIISTILSFGFKDIYTVKKLDKKSFISNLKAYKHDLKITGDFIIHSKRMRSFMLFKIVFFSLIKIVEVYERDLLVVIGIPEEQFSMIFAILTFIAAYAVLKTDMIERKFKNRTLAFTSLTYIFTIILIGVMSRATHGIAVPFLLIFLVILKICVSTWFIHEGKYLRNFTNETARNKIAFTYELISSLAAAGAAVLGSLLVKVLSIQDTFLVVGLVGLIGLILTLDYMRTRFGLKPSEYEEKDIELKIT